MLGNNFMPAPTRSWQRIFEGGPSLAGPGRLREFVTDAASFRGKIVCEPNLSVQGFVVSPRSN